jgi:hypothetical protein
MVEPRDEDEEMGNVDTSQSRFVEDTVHLRDEAEEIARVDPLLDEDEEMVDPYSNAGASRVDDSDSDSDDGDSDSDDGNSDSDDDDSDSDDDDSDSDDSDTIMDDAGNSNAEDAHSETLERAEFSDVEDFEDGAGISSGTTLRKRQIAALVCYLFCLSAHR